MDNYTGQIHTENLARRLPAVPLRGMTVLPGMVLHFDISRETSVKAVDSAMRSDERVFLVTRKGLDDREVSIDDVCSMGTIAKIKQISRLPKNISRVFVVGESRAYLDDLDTDGPFLTAGVRIVPEDMFFARSPYEEEAMMRSLKEAFYSYSLVYKHISQEIVRRIEMLQDIRTLVDTVCAELPVFYETRQQLLEATDLRERYDLLLSVIAREIDILQLKGQIQERVKQRIDKNQREYFLREQLKVIREELGEDTVLSDADRFEEEADKLTASDEVREKIKREIVRFKNASGNTAEQGVIRTYIETMLEMPWDRVSEDSRDLKKAARILDEDHYGLEDVKERVLEFLSVKILSKKGVTPILCLVGPPGTGKSSIARSVARALDKQYVRISLGGIRDEAEIRGHRKTYVGAMPGRIANGMKQAGTANPLMLLDEIDKVSSDLHRGDTFSALLEVLDSEQNNAFRDHYLEVPVNLSQVMFITTANTTQTIPRPLLDRMEVIEVSSYTENEKVHIAAEHLLPKQKEKNGLEPGQLAIGKNTMTKIVRGYTKEAGVRNLERTLGEICRKAAREIVEEKKKKITVTSADLEKYLGKEKYSYRKANKRDDVGIVRGLAWTPVGGDTLQIEVNIMPGKGEILLTGQLGDVMKESAQAGISYLRSVSARYQIPEDFFAVHDIHVHIPAGAVPKDGPSAGITMATAVFSAATGRPVRASLAMTGEITLRGRILPIGGLKEKLLAAKQAGIRQVLVPEKNRPDVAELSSEITDGLRITYVSQMDEVIENAFAEA